MTKPILPFAAAAIVDGNGKLTIADDPLVFRSGLLDQYAPYTAAQAADLAASGIRGSLAPPEVKARLLAGVDTWLRQPPPP